MSKRKKSASKSSRKITPPFPALGGILFIGGIFVVILGLMILRLTVRDLTLWLMKDRYVQTEMEVVEMHIPIEDNASAIVRIASTGEEVRFTELSSHFYKSETPDSVIASLKSRDEVIGMKVPIWYWRDAHTFLADNRIVTEHKELPTAKIFLRTLFIQTLVLGGGIWCIRTGYRRIKPAIDAKEEVELQ